MRPLLDFRGRTVVLTGAATGIGAATADRFVDAGAHLHTLDIAPIESTVERARVTDYRGDLGDVESIDTAVGELPDHIDVLVNCAGVPNGGRFSPAEVMAVNWLGLRHLTESLLDRLPDGGAIVHVASTAGRHWDRHRSELVELLDQPTFADGQRWVAQHPDVCGDGYAFSKEAVQWYTMCRAVDTARRGVRMNSICPGVTNTRLNDDFRRGVGADAIDRAVSIAGRPAEPAEMAPAVLFLADDASSSYINGVNLVIDRGSGAARITDP